MSEKCKACGQELPPDPTPFLKTGVMKWVQADRSRAAVEVDGRLVSIWIHECPTLSEVTLSEGDRVELTVRANRYGEFDVIRVALPAQAEAPANADAEAGV